LTGAWVSVIGAYAFQKEFAVAKKAKKAKKEVDTRTKAEKEADEEYYWNNWMPNAPQNMWPDLKSINGE
jgi:hypothetical protein